MRLPKIVTIAIVLCLGSACTAVKATYHILAAEQSLSQAREHGAPDLAVYEYTMATRYLEKAREESGFADYRVSEQLAKKSAEWSDKAIISIEQRGRRNVELDLQLLDDRIDLEGMRPPPPPPPPVAAPVPQAPPPVESDEPANEEDEEEFLWDLDDEGETP